MSGIFIVLMIIFFICIWVFFDVMVSIGAAGGSPSKFLSDILKYKTYKIKAITKKTTESSSDKVEVTETIMRWRTITGILFSILMLFFLAFYRPGFMSAFFPWVEYAFIPVLILTIISYIILAKKEQNIGK